MSPVVARGRGGVVECACANGAPACPEMTVAFGAKTT